MNDWQRTVVASFTTLFIVAALFFIPWKRADSGEIRWAPFYRNPITYESSFSGSATTNQYARMKGRKMPVLYLFQLAAIVGAGLLTYRMVSQDIEDGTGADLDS